jgi:putative ABC transport system permease protein
MIKALDRKLLRDLVRLRGQVGAIALVIASGVGVLVMSLSTIEALDETATAYYERYRFAQVFASVKRAPERLAARIARVPGVQSVETRIVEQATLDVEGFTEPVVGQLVSIPEQGEPALNRLAIRSGRRVLPGRPDEVVVSEPFAEAHGLVLGAHLSATINGHRRSLQVVGIALSPEFVYAIGPGALMPDDERFGILWMGREALAAAYDLEEAFNDISLSLLRSTDPDAVIERLDRLLAPYGGVGAFDRSAFLANMALTRLIAIERSEIGLLKAFGYSRWVIGWHYVKLVIAMTAPGILLGWTLGYWLGWVNTVVYAELYRFPFLYFAPGPSAFTVAALISLGAVVIGTLTAVRRAVALPAAEAMLPPSPPTYRRAGWSTRWLAQLLDQPTRMILRQILRWPLRSFLTTMGIAMSVAVLVISFHWVDAINHLVEVYFVQAQRQDMTVGLVEARSSTVLPGLARLPGVLAVEPMRTVQARLRSENRFRRETVQGVLPKPVLSLVYDVSGRALTVPPEGLVLSTKLAEILGVGRGDIVTVEVLEGRRPVLRVPVAELFETYIGAPAYMHIDVLNRLMRERPSVTGAHLLVDKTREEALFAELKEVPQVSAVTLRRASVNKFHETMAETLLVYVSFFTAFACALAFGVVYNSGRIALSERGRELATLRVLGFTRFEVSYILLGETALLAFIALPLGCLVGYQLAWLISATFETELFRVPLVIQASTFGTSALIGLVATAVSAALVRRRLDRLDLIAVLKTRE